MSSPDKLISGYEVELIEDHHSFGSGRYGGRIILEEDISAVFPYLNAVLEDAIYDHENGILIGVSNGKRYAFRPREIQAGMVNDINKAATTAAEVTELVNSTWREREKITPSLRERRLPTVYEIYKLLPGGNCKECGYTTCLAFAGDLRNGVISLESCPEISKPEYLQNRERIRELFGPDSTDNP